MSEESDRTGEAGIGILQLKVPKLLGYIFRPVPQSDHGIDGEIEVTKDAGGPPGRLVLTQVKSGPSYFKEPTDTGFIFRGKRRHLEYWQYHSLPVIVVLVDVEAEIAYWVEVDSSAVTTGVQWKIEVPKSQILDVSAKAPLREIANKLADELAARAQKDFEAIREVYLEGRRRAAFAELSALVKQPSWRFAPRALQADGFRSLALWSFVLTQDPAATEAYLLQAKTSDVNSDETVVRAMMTALTKGAEAALPILENPTTGPVANMRALFLAVSGHVPEAEAALNEWPRDIPRTTETTRVEAVIAYAAGDLDKARERITAAASEKPRWSGIRETDAIIEYASSLPPSEWPEIALGVPPPVPRVLLRHDDASLGHLRRAAALFADLLEGAESEEDRGRFEIWHLATLANDPSALAKAKEVANEALARPKLSGALLAWVLQRDLLDSRDALIERLLSDVGSMAAAAVRTDPGLVFLAVQMLFTKDRRQEAATILDRFDEHLLAQNPDALHYWRSRIAAAAGDAPTASAEAALITRADMRADASEAAAGTSGESDWRRVAEERLASYRKDGDAALLFDAISMYSAHEEWETVLGAAEELFGLLPNLAVLETICRSAWRLGRYRLYLDWINRWREVSSMRTEELEQTRVACLVQVDPLAGAQAARALVHDYPSSENVVRAMTALLRIGDIKSASIEARNLLEDAAIDSGTLLNAAQMTSNEDRDLAIALFRRAMDLGVDDDHVGTAVSLAHQLGEDHATASLIPRMQQLAADGRGGITAMSLPELLEYGKGHQERLADILARFHAAEMPIHGVARTIGWTLAEMFRVWAADNREEPSVIRHRPLLARFGGLPPPSGGRLTGRSLAMDITALLLGADLEILDDVERAYAPIRISRFLPAAIFEQQRRLDDAQPSRLEMFERIVRLVDSGKVKLLSGTEPEIETTGDHEFDFFLGVAAPDMRFVEQLPMTDRDMQPITLAAEAAARIMSLSDLLAAAKRDAVVDDEAHRDVVIGLPPATAEPEIIPGKIVLSDLATTTLAGSAALEQLARSSEIYVLQRVVEEARASLAWSVRRRDIFNWLERLRERIRQGLEKGVYVASGEADIDIDDPRDLDFETLRDLLKDADEATQALWIEDRACSRIAGSVIGIGDVLADLRQRGELSESTHAALGHKLRAGGMRYLPLDRDDVVHFLKTAKSRKLPDTNELQTVSRYLAGIALDGNRSNGTAGKPPEIAVIFDSSRVTASAVPEIWKLHREDQERAMQHAAWFMTNVYAGRLATRASSDPTAAPELAKEDTAADLAQLYIGALIVALRELPDDWEESATAGYIHWVSSAFALRKFFTDPDLVSATGRHLAGMARHFSEEFEAREELKGLDALLAPIFALLPSELQEAWLSADPEFGKKHGYRSIEGVQVSGQSVPAVPFWTSLEDALHSRSSLEDADVRVSLEENAISVQHGTSTMRIEDPLFLTFAREDADISLAWAAAHGDFLDMPREKRRAEATRIGAYATARERVIAADELRGGGGQVFYHSLRERLRAGGSIPESGFHLSAQALADHLRWTTGDREASARQLIDDVGVEEALRRLVTLPLLMPAAAVAALEGSQNRVEIIRRVAKGAASPLSIIQSAAIALRFADASEDLLKLGNELADWVLSHEYAGEGYEAFEQAYSVTNSWLSFDPTVSAFTVDDRLILAMSHASRLLDTLGVGRLPSAHKFFAKVAALPRESLSRDAEFFDHALYPNNLDFTRVVVGGLASRARDIPASVRESSSLAAKLHAALVRLKEAKRIGSLFIDSSLRHSDTPTLFDEEPRDAILSVVSDPPFEIPASSALAAALTDVLRDAVDDPATTEWWIPLRAIAQQHALRPENLKQVQQLIAKLSEEDTRRQLTDQNLVMSLSSLAGHAATSDEAVRKQFTELYLLVAGEFSSGKRDAKLLPEIGPAFLEVAFALSARQHDPMASARELANHIDELLRVWPAVAYAVATRLSDLVWTTPVDQSVPLWRIVMRARESPR